MCIRDREDIFARTNESDAVEQLPVNLNEVVQNIEDRYIALAMKKAGSIRKAAKLLNVSPTSLFRNINRE